jgi:hypothetical protein
LSLRREHLNSEGRIADCEGLYSAKGGCIVTIMVAEPLKGVNPLFHQVYWLPIVWGNLHPLQQYSCCSSSLYQTQEIIKQSYIIL